MLTALLSASVAKPVEIYGNAYGLWGPHPHVTSGDKPNSPVLYELFNTYLERASVEQPDSETVADADVSNLTICTTFVPTSLTN